MLKLIELKLASGLTAEHRQHDLADVATIIRMLKPPRTLGDGLDPSVREEFYRLWDSSRNDPFIEWPPGT